MQRLTPEALAILLDKLPKWQRAGSSIRREFEFSNFIAAMVFVNRVADAAEAAQHHPDIDIRWNRVGLAFTTHDAGGLTVLDFELAAACDRLIFELASPSEIGFVPPA